MKQRLSALTALCLTGVLVLSTVAGATETDQTAPAEASDTAQTDTAASDDAAAADTVNDTTQQPDTTTDADNADAAQPSESEPGEPASDDAEESGTDETNTVPADETEPEETEENEENPQEQQPEDEIEEFQQDETEQKVVGSYQGIKIDGDFSDWDAVKKMPVTTGHSLSEAAMVWDGDYIYLYFKVDSGNWNAVTWDGPNSNGRFEITTDLGRTLMVQLAVANGPVVNGVDGATAAVDSTDWGRNSYQWEVAVPASQLPAYKETISFGFYLGETFVADVANLQGSSEQPTDPENPEEPEKPDDGNKDFTGIVYDGLYGDWEYYPHTLINYATPGTQEDVVDAEAALYATGGKLYAHAVTAMPAHLTEAGGEFTDSTLIRINGKEDYTFRARFVAIDENGNINFSPDLKGLAAGNYEFYMLDAAGWQVKHISQLEPGRNMIYGKMYMTLSPSKDEMEYEVDLDVLAEKFGLKSSDIRTLEGYWERLGDKWVSTAGTPTGAGMGIFLCLSTTGVAYLAQRRRKKQG